MRRPQKYALLALLGGFLAAWFTFSSMQIESDTLRWQAQMLTINEILIEDLPPTESERLDKNLRAVVSPYLPGLSACLMTSEASRAPAAFVVSISSKGVLEKFEWSTQIPLSDSALRCLEEAQREILWPRGEVPFQAALELVPLSEAS